MKRIAIALSVVAVAATAYAAGFRSVTVFGSWLSITGTNLTSSYQLGSQVQLRGTDELDAPISATFDAATALTGLDFEIVVSDDGSTWYPVQSTNSITGLTQAAHTLTASAGNTVTGRLQTTSHRDAKYTAIQVKTSSGSGASKAGDAASSTLNYSQSF